MTRAVNTPTGPCVAAFLYLHAALRSAGWRKTGTSPPSIRFGDTGGMSRASRKLQLSASEQLRQLLGEPWPFPGRPSKHHLSEWIVTDDWPERVPVTQAEIDVFEGWFGDLFDELFGPCR